MKTRFVLSLLAALALMFGAATPALAATGPEKADLSSSVSVAECLRCPL
ncbi:hypothetical protein SAMN05216266_105250 [Amycolatopsis marina]|uniref:Uncharacterized protein n=1 Tax=Amycolatopsis marina TaxID=490629 RepID=A0A1I0YPN9_9PSEU|nr:hypothetical protein [Amycolatopsis marina]SFB15349.1 hypothetical protein SAMN05216266_105250 [Amycolatopsis marina]